MLPHTCIIGVITSGPFHRRPRYHDTASRRTPASSKMQTGYFSTCMPACFRLLLMNHLVHTHSFMFMFFFFFSPFFFFDPQEPRTRVLFCQGPRNFVPRRLENTDAQEVELICAYDFSGSFILNLEDSSAIASENIFHSSHFPSIRQFSTLVACFLIFHLFKCF